MCQMYTAFNLFEEYDGLYMFNYVYIDLQKKLVFRPQVIILLGAQHLTEFQHMRWLWSLRQTRTRQRTYLVDFSVSWIWAGPVCTCCPAYCIFERGGIHLFGHETHVLWSAISIVVLSLFSRLVLTFHMFCIKALHIEVWTHVRYNCLSCAAFTRDATAPQLFGLWPKLEEKTWKKNNCNPGSGTSVTSCSEPKTI